MPMQYHVRWLAAILLVALALRAAAAWWVGTWLDGRWAFPDSESYWALAQAVAEGEPYRVEAAYLGPQGARVFRAPGYPLLLAPVVRLAPADDQVPAARLLGAVLGTAAVAGVWWWGRQLSDDAAALVAAGAVALYPGALATSTFILSEAGFCPLMIAQLALWTAAGRAATVRRVGGLAAAAGLAGGLATLMRPSWLLFTPLAAVVALATRRGAGRAGQPRRPWRLLVLELLALGLGMLVTLAPWWARNYRVTGCFVPTTLQVGASLYDGLNPRANGASNMKFVDQIAWEERALWEAGGKPGDLEVWLDRAFRRRALDWAQRHPGRVVGLAIEKIRRMWSPWPNEASFSRPLLGWSMVFTYIPGVVFGIIGAARSLGRGWGYALAWLPAVYLTALHMVFVGSIRYREPAMMALAVLAAGAAVGLVRRARAAGRPS